jgi:hypothetical protein
VSWKPENNSSNPLLLTLMTYQVEKDPALSSVLFLNVFVGSALLSLLLKEPFLTEMAQLNMCYHQNQGKVGP